MRKYRKGEFDNPRVVVALRSLDIMITAQYEESSYGNGNFFVSHVHCVNDQHGLAIK